MFQHWKLCASAKYYTYFYDYLVVQNNLVYNLTTVGHQWCQLEWVHSEHQPHTLAPVADPVAAAAAAVGVGGNESGVMVLTGQGS